MEGSSTRKFTKICVFCGSSPGKTSEFIEAAETLSKMLAERNIHLVYGGGSLGLMGRVATATQNNGSRVLGIIPKALADGDIVGKTIGDELQVSSMHERISFMLRNADAFIALPGGFGTLEEIFQIVSWAQLQIHKKPIGLLNVDGFYNGLLSFLDYAVEKKFVSSAARQILISASTVDQLLDELQAFTPLSDPTMSQIDWYTDDNEKKRKINLTFILRFVCSLSTYMYF